MKCKVANLIHSTRCDNIKLVRVSERRKRQPLASVETAVEL